MRDRVTDSRLALAFTQSGIGGSLFAGIRVGDLPIFRPARMLGLDLFQQLTAATNEAVEAARDVIEWSLQDSESMEKFNSYTGIRVNKHAFEILKGKFNKKTGKYPTPNAGCHIIKEFLGERSWSPETIRHPA